MTSGVMGIEPIWGAIGAERAKDLLAFHTFTGADNIGRFSHIGKATWLQVYLKADSDTVKSLKMFTTEPEVSETMLVTLASFVCAAYSSKGICIKTIPELRWHLFRKHMAESDKLHPTLYSVGSSVGSHIEGLPQGSRWPAETNNDRCSSSSKGNNWDG